MSRAKLTSAGRSAMTRRRSGWRAGRMACAPDLRMRLRGPGACPRDPTIASQPVVVTGFVEMMGPETIAGAEGSRDWRPRWTSQTGNVREFISQLYRRRRHLGRALFADENGRCLRELLVTRGLRLGPNRRRLLHRASLALKAVTCRAGPTIRQPERPAKVLVATRGLWDCLTHAHRT